ncbi:hypothetical protein EJB05_54436 [Eragrostis curvula]|uniref:Uncharacterized protein n=1 Tax=Eragrostis curvula TaxID=38414 RepID=A0A5J9SMA7_9POAL|nr:hypothetical protein EJB05_54436 [Eragrostis curvula]
MLRGFVTTGVAERRGICAWRRLRGLESCTSYSIEYLRQAARQPGSTDQGRPSFASPSIKDQAGQGKEEARGIADCVIATAVLISGSVILYMGKVVRTELISVYAVPPAILTSSIDVNHSQRLYNPGDLGH